MTALRESSKERKEEGRRLLAQVLVDLIMASRELTKDK